MLETPNQEGKEKIKQLSTTETTKTPETTKKRLITPETLMIYKPQIINLLGINEQDGTINKPQDNMKGRKGITIKNMGKENGEGRSEMGSDAKVTGDISDPVNGGTIVEFSDGSFIKIDYVTKGYKSIVSYKALTETEKQAHLEKVKKVDEENDRKYADNLVSDM